MDTDAVLDEQPRRTRLRQLPIERYLVDTDGGWVIRRALGYRGRVQIEDEQAAGRRLLEQLYSQVSWTDSNFLLARELARVVPHGEENDIARRLRREAVELAALDPAADRWRAEIHGAPDATTAARLRDWLARQQRSDVRELGARIVADLDALYGAGNQLQRARQLLAGLNDSMMASAWTRRVDAALSLPAAEQLAPLCEALATARREVFPLVSAERRIALVDVQQALETQAQLAFQEFQARPSVSRRDWLGAAAALADCSYSAGLLTTGERAALEAALDSVSDDNISLAEYRRTISMLRRVPGWAAGTVRHTFAEALIAYTALDTRAARFADDLLRGSPVWPMGQVLRVLSADVDRLTGQTAEFFDEQLPTAIALNAGIATGRLRIFATLDEALHATMGKNDIVVLPETIAELAPVAGILTLGEGNPVSHVQLLARNFAIPNVAIAPEAIERLQPYAGQEVVLAVSASGSVILRRVDERVRAALQEPDRQAISQLTVPVPDLEQTRLLGIDELSRGLSGKVVGPKAANLGELNRLFPGRVAPALAIPFGVYAAHLEAAGLDKEIAAAFAAQAAGEASQEETFARLAAIRQRIAALELSPALRDELEEAMAREFARAGRGVFVRSDTNVEDLPQFTGAGLNETLPHVVGVDAQFAAIPRVWGSILSPRALAWRSSVLTNPDRIYASVLLMLSVPVDKSGVLVTANLVERGAPGMTTATAWGVGGAVAGEAAETLIVTADSQELVSEAKAPYRRKLEATGGIGWDSSDLGPVLTTREVAQLRSLAAEVADKYEPVLDELGRQRPWDIEFGFIAGRLTLFQIRPLVERGSGRVDAIVSRLQRRAPAALPDHSRIDLRDTPGGVD